MRWLTTCLILAACGTGAEAPERAPAALDENAAEQDPAAEEPAPTDGDDPIPQVPPDWYVLDECELGLDECDANADCIDTEEFYECRCRDGLRGDGFACEDIDECAEESAGCDVNARCTNVVPGFLCECGAYVGEGPNAVWTAEGFFPGDGSACRPRYVAVSAGERNTCAIRKDGTLWCWGNVCTSGSAPGSMVGHGQGECTDLGYPQRAGFQSDQWLAVSVGTLVACGIKRDELTEDGPDGPDGALWCWGNASFGRAAGGLRSNLGLYRPTLAAPGRWLRLATGPGDHGCGIQRDGSIWCWGANRYGQLGVGLGGERLFPEQVAGGPWIDVSVGAEATVAVSAAGALWSWGRFFGDGAPVCIEEGCPGGWRRVSISSGGAVCASKEDGSLWCWGATAEGQLGVGEVQVNQLLVPTRVDGVPPLVDGDGFDLGANLDTRLRSHGCVVADGQLLCWGRDDRGQVGVGGPGSPVLSPARIGAEQEWQSTDVGGSHSCALTRDGALYCWGSLTFGQIGAGVTGLGFTPALVRHGNGSALRGARTLVAGGSTSCAIADDRAWCWGDNREGQLQDGTVASSRRPQEVPSPDGETWTDLTFGSDFGCGVTDAGRLYCWGQNNVGQAGVGPDTSPRREATRVGDQETWVDVEAGHQHACALDVAGTLSCWGFRGNGRLGRPDASFYYPAVVTVADPDTQEPLLWRLVRPAYEHTCAIDMSGRLWCWGSGRDGRLGPGVCADSGPRLVSDYNDWTDVASTRLFNCGLRAGEVWCWGRAATVNCEDDPRSVPAKRCAGPECDDSDETWTLISGGAAHTECNMCGGRADGSAWCWGCNGSPHHVWQLALGGYPYSFEGTQIQAPVTPQMVEGLANVDAVVMGLGHACAQSGDSVYCWGENSFGQTASPGFVGVPLEVVPP